MELAIVALTDIRGNIALEENDKLEWGSKEDKTFFRQLTTQYGTIIMGRKTFENIGRKLPNRLNVVLSSKEKIVLENGDRPDLIIFGTVHEIIRKAEEIGISKACVIGGRKVFTQFLNSGVVNKIYLTIEPVILPSYFNIFSQISSKILLKLEYSMILNENGTLLAEYKVLY